MCVCQKMRKETFEKVSNKIKELCVCVKDGKTDEIGINRTKEPIFKQVLPIVINKEQQHDEEDLINSLALLLDVSPMTISRYLNKACSSVGIFERVLFKGRNVVKYKA